MRKLPAYGLALSIGLLVLGPVAEARVRVRPPQRQPAPFSLKIQAPIPVGQPPTIDISDAPETGAFLLYFLHLSGLDATADRAVAAGNPQAIQWKSYEQRVTGLTEAEGAILKGAAYACNQSLSDYDAAAQAQATASEEPPTGRVQLGSSAVDQLRSSLGYEAFQKVAQRVQALFGNVGFAESGGLQPGPLPVDSFQVGSGSGDLRPPVAADSTLPHTDVFSEVMKLDENTFFAECITSPQDDLTIYYYISGKTACQMYGSGIGPVAIECDAFGPGICSTTFSNIPGQTFVARGLHALRMRFSICSSEFGDVDCLDDPLHYGSPPGTQLTDFLDGSRIFAPGGPEVFWPSIFPNDAWLIAATHSTPVTFLNVSPRQVTLFPNGTQHFTSNIPAKWYIFGPGNGPGTIDVNTGVFSAPASITSTQTTTIEVCDADPQFQPYLVDCVHATVTLQPLKVELAPDSAEVLPDGHRNFSATVTPSTPAQTVTWTVIDPTHSAVITPNTVDSSRAVFAAPPSSKISATQELTVKACVTPNQSATEVCGTAKVLVPKLQIFISAPKQRLITGETVQLTALVIGSSLPRPVEWTATPEIPDAKLTVITPDTLVVTYKASPFEKNPIFIQACLKDAGDICSDPYRLEIVDPVTITSVTGDWDAGELAAPFTITGTGFGAHPTVSFSGLQSTVTAATDTLISGVAVIPVGKGGGSTKVTVTANYSNGDFASILWPLQGAIQIVPVSLLAISPATAELRAGESKPFAAICLTAKAAACSSPETVSWGASPGAIAPTTGMNVTYTAPPSGTSTQATISACWSGGTLCAPPAHVTLLPAVGVTVAVSPKTATVQAGAHTQPFSAQVTGSTNTSVTWSLQPQTAEAGNITQAGVYSAPATLGSVSTVTVIATSQADTTRKDTATVTLTAAFCQVDGTACGGDGHHTCHAGACACTDCNSSVCCGASGNAACDGQQHFDANTGYTGVCKASLGACSAANDFDGTNDVFHDGDIVACVKRSGVYSWTPRRPSPRCKEVSPVCDYLCTTHYANGLGVMCDQNGYWNQNLPLSYCNNGTIPAAYSCQVSPMITSQPQSVTINPGATATLSVTASGTSLSYQWYQGVAPNKSQLVTGGSAATIFVSPASTTSYWVEVWNNAGTVDSITATVTIGCGADGASCGGDGHHTCQAGACACTDCNSSVCCGASGNAACNGQQHFDANTGYTGVCQSTLGACNASNDFNGTNNVFHNGDILACVKRSGVYGWTPRRPSPRCQEVSPVCDYLCANHFIGGAGFMCDSNGNWNTNLPLANCYGGTIPSSYLCP